ncbi:hypothetical protein FCM35_KLT07145 [Carex littledalei]|uniref:Uncharacterized protein n=1 Tax=Carex littledalei TaxID=544730 RepID=A0A833V725_9POAL|nr:hypothetical protein FCM35_KLT07145 [Carex littledalei]
MASLQEARRERDEAVARMAEEDEAACNRGGATKDKTQEVSDKAREVSKDDRMEETKDTAKMMDYEDTSEEKGSSSEKLGEYKESAAEAARKAREFLVEGKEKARVELAGKTKDRKGETDESCRKQLEDVKHRAAEKAKEDQRKLDEPDEGDKGRSATENIYSSFPSMTESIKEKMTLPEDIVARKKGQYGGGDEVRDDKMRERESRGEEDTMLRVKDADQMTGTFSTDPGKMGGEGKGPADAKKSN